MKKTLTALFSFLFFCPLWAGAELVNKLQIPDQTLSSLSITIERPINTYQDYSIFTTWNIVRGTGRLTQTTHGKSLIFYSDIIKGNTVIRGNHRYKKFEPTGVNPNQTLNPGEFKIFKIKIPPEMLGVYKVSVLLTKMTEDIDLYARINQAPVNNSNRRADFQCTSDSMERVKVIADICSFKGSISTDSVSLFVDNTQDVYIASRGYMAGKYQLLISVEKTPSATLSVKSRQKNNASAEKVILKSIEKRATTEFTITKKTPFDGYRLNLIDITTSNQVIHFSSLGFSSSLWGLPVNYSLLLPSGITLLKKEGHRFLLETFEERATFNLQMRARMNFKGKVLDKLYPFKVYKNSLLDGLSFHTENVSTRNRKVIIPIPKPYSVIGYPIDSSLSSSIGKTRRVAVNNKDRFFLYTAPNNLVNSTAYLTFSQFITYKGRIVAKKSHGFYVSASKGNVVNYHWNVDGEYIVNVDRIKTIHVQLLLNGKHLNVSGFDIDSSNTLVRRGIIFTTNTIQVNLSRKHSGKTYTIEPFYIDERGWVNSTKVRIVINSPPDFKLSTSSLFINAGTSKTIVYQASDKDGDAVSMPRLIIDSGYLSILSKKNKIVFTADGESNSFIRKYIFKIEDDRGGFSTDSILVEVNQKPSIRILTVLPTNKSQYSITEGNEVRVWQHSTDDNYGVIETRWLSNLSEGGIISTSSKAHSTLTSYIASIPSTNTIYVMAIDSRGAVRIEPFFFYVIPRPKLSIDGDLWFVENKVIGRVQVKTDGRELDKLTWSYVDGAFISFEHPNSSTTDVIGNQIKQGWTFVEVEATWSDIKNPPVFERQKIDITDVFSTTAQCFQSGQSPQTSSYSQSHDYSVCGRFNGENNRLCRQRIDNQCQWNFPPPFDAQKCALAKVMPSPRIHLKDGTEVDNINAYNKWGLSKDEYIRKYNNPKTIASRCLDSGYRKISMDGIEEWIEPPILKDEIKGLDNQRCWDWKVDYVCVGKQKNSCVEWDTSTNSNRIGEFDNLPMNWQRKGSSEIAVISDIYQAGFKKMSRFNERVYFSQNERWKPVCTRDSNKDRAYGLEKAHCETDDKGNVIPTSCQVAPLIGKITDGAIPLDEKKTTINETIVYEISSETSYLISTVAVRVSDNKKSYRLEYYPRKLKYGVINEREKAIFSETTTISYTHDELLKVMKEVDGNPIEVNIEQKLNKYLSTDIPHFQDIKNENYWQVKTHYRSYTHEQIKSCQASCLVPEHVKVVSCSKYDVSKTPIPSWGKYRFCVEPIFESYCPSTLTLTVSQPSDPNCGVSASYTTSSISGDIVDGFSVKQCYKGQPEACIPKNQISDCELVDYKGVEPPLRTGLYDKQIQTWKCKRPEVVCMTEETKTVCKEEEIKEKRPPSSFDKAATAMALAEKTKGLKQKDLLSGKIRLFEGKKQSCKYLTDDGANYMKLIAYGVAAYEAYSAVSGFSAFTSLAKQGATQQAQKSLIKKAYDETTNAMSKAAAAEVLTMNPDTIEQQRKCCGSYDEVTKRIEGGGIVSKSVNSVAGQDMGDQPVCNTQDARVSISKEKGKYTKNNQTHFIEGSRDQYYKGAVYYLGSKVAETWPNLISPLSDPIVVKREKEYCVFQTPFDRIVQQQAKSQINRLAYVKAQSTYEKTFAVNSTTWQSVLFDDEVHISASREGMNVMLNVCVGGKKEPACQSPPNKIDNSHFNWNLFYVDGGYKEQIAFNNKLITSGKCGQHECTYTLRKIGADNDQLFDQVIEKNSSSVIYLGLIEAIIMFDISSNQGTISLKRLDKGDIFYTIDTFALDAKSYVLKNNKDITLSSECDDYDCHLLFNVKTVIHPIGPKDCRGLTPQEIALIDFNKIDFSQYIESLKSNGNVDEVEGADMIKKMTGIVDEHTKNPKPLVVKGESLVYLEDGVYFRPGSEVVLIVKSALPNGTLKRVVVDWGDGETSNATIETRLKDLELLNDTAMAEKTACESKLNTFFNNKESLREAKNKSVESYGDNCANNRFRQPNWGQEKCATELNNINDQEKRLSDYLCIGQYECASDYIDEIKDSSSTILLKKERQKDCRLLVKHQKRKKGYTKKQKQFCEDSFKQYGEKNNPLNSKENQIHQCLKRMDNSCGAKFKKTVPSSRECVLLANRINEFYLGYKKDYQFRVSKGDRSIDVPHYYKNQGERKYTLKITVFNDTNQSWDVEYRIKAIEGSLPATIEKDLGGGEIILHQSNPQKSMTDVYKQTQ